jgi:hypothetical protein
MLNKRWTNLNQNAGVDKQTACKNLMDAQDTFNTPPGRL